MLATQLTKRKAFSQLIQINLDLLPVNLFLAAIVLGIGILALYLRRPAMINRAFYSAEFRAIGLYMVSALLFYRRYCLLTNPQDISPVVVTMARRF